MGAPSMTMKVLWASTLRAKFFNLLVINLAVIGVAVLVLWQWRIDPTLRAAVSQRQEHFLRRASAQISEFVDERTKRLITAGEIGRFWEANDDAQNQALTRLMKLDPQIRQVLYVDPTGKRINQLTALKFKPSANRHSFARAEVCRTDARQHFLWASRI